MKTQLKEKLGSHHTTVTNKKMIMLFKNLIGLFAQQRSTPGPFPPNFRCQFQNQLFWQY